MVRVRNPNVFEKVLLVLGVAIVLIGYSFIYRMFKFESLLSWDAIHAIFLWLILIGVIIMVAVTENMKEELRIVIENQNEELKLLRKEVNDSKKQD